MPEQRKLSQIAVEIVDKWKTVSPHAKPYLRAMLHLSKPTDMYGADSAKSIVIYFISNATGWRGDDARRIKAELKSICGIK